MQNSYENADYRPLAMLTLACVLHRFFFIVKSLQTHFFV